MPYGHPSSLAAVAVLLACADPSAPAVDHDLGIAVTGLDEQAYLAEWTDGGNAITYVSQSLPGPTRTYFIRTVVVSTGERRTVTQRSCPIQRQQTSPDGQWVFYVGEHDAGDVPCSVLAVYRVSTTTGDTALIADSAWTFALSPDGALLAYGRYAGPVVLVDLTTGEGRALPAAGCPLTFSPNGASLLLSCRLAHGGFDSVTIATAAVEPLHVVLNESQAVLLVRWDPDGIRLLVGESTGHGYLRFSTWNLTTRQTRVVWTWPYTSGESVTDGYSWSKDGRWIALWTQTGLEGSGATLHVVSADGRGERYRSTLTAAGSAVVFAPDDRRIAFESVYGVIYVKDVPLE